jgi:DNA-binding MarR family transcriptional regulator
MSRIVDRLEARGLVRRERCSSDARSWEAVLTKGGLDRLQQPGQPT